MKIGIVGGGQLGQMLAQAGLAMGHTFRFLVPEGECCVESLGEVVRSDFKDPESLRAFSQGLDAITFEWENVPIDTLKTLESAAPVRPSPRCAAIAKDRIQEKRLFQKSGLNVQKFAPVSSVAELETALDFVGVPAMLKTRGQGYDGKGQRRIDDRALAARAFEDLGKVPCILEEFVRFDFEISLIAVRGKTSQSGKAVVKFYPACRNRHVNGILDETCVPAEGVSNSTLHVAQAAILGIMEGLDYEGVMCVEFFVSNTDSGQMLIANEFAPRVHNSGHWSIEGADTSQFANHILAIAREPLGSTALKGESVMFNIVGTIPASLGRNSGAHVHLYGKTPRPGRKLGHVTAVGVGARQLAELALKYP